MKKTNLLLSVVLGVTATVAPVSASMTYLTNFTKSNNIYTNLNEEYPHTGTGVPGSGTGTPNATFLFDPSSSAVQAAGYTPDYLPSSNLVNNGVDFELTSDASGHDFEEINSGPGISITANVANVQTVYMLLGAYNGQNFNVTFTGLDGTTQTFNNIFVPDFNGGSINSTSATVNDQTLFQVHDVGAGGSGNSTTGATNNYDLTEVGFTLEPSLADQKLTTIGLTSNGYDTLLLGVTVSSVPEPSTVALALAGVAGLWVRRRRAVR